MSVILFCQEPEAADIALGDETRDARLAEIESCLFPERPLKPVAQARLMVEFKQLYEERYPETASGLAQARGANRVKGGVVSADSAPTFSKYINSRCGWSLRKTESIVRRGTVVRPEALDAVKGSRLDTATFLDELTKISPPQQEAYAREKLSNEAPRSRHVGCVSSDNPIWDLYVDSPREVQMAFLDRLANRRGGIQP